MGHLSTDVNQIEASRQYDRLIVKISSQFNVLPSPLILDGIELSSPHSVAGGGFADVFKARYFNTDVALKRFRLFAADAHFSQERACREIVLWSRLKHDHVLQFIGVDMVTFAGRPCLVTPWMGYGVLDAYIKANTHHVHEIDKLVCPPPS